MSKINTLKSNNFRIDYLESATNYPAIFEKLLAGTRDENGVPADWKLLQETYIDEGRIEIKKAWRVPVGDGFLFFKMRKINRKCNLDRWWRGLKIASWRLMHRLERARERGFTYPMQILLAAERRERGFLREEYIIAEWIETMPIDDSQNLNAKAELLKNILAAHKFGICWGGDPCNIIRENNGNYRGIDIYPGEATWLERAKDLDNLSKNGVTLPRFYLNVAVFRLQDKIKLFLRKIRGRKEQEVSIFEAPRETSKDDSHS